MSGIFQNVLEISIMASFMIAAVWLVRVCFKKSTAVFRCLLWMLVGIRLLIPVNIAVPFSLVPNVNLDEIQESIGSVQNGERSDRVEAEYIQTASGESWNQELVDGNQVMVPGQVIETSENSENEWNQSGNQSQSPAEVSGSTLLEGLTVYSVSAMFWLLGMILMLGYMLISGWRLHKNLETAVPEIVNFGGKQIKIYRDEHISSPFLLGIFSPKIYVPFQMEEQNLQYVLAHELTHIRRRDYVWKPLSFVVLSFYWFNPLVWVAYILLGRDIEAACDEQVLRSKLVQDKADYAKALLSCASGQRRIAVCPVAVGESDVKKRVKNVMSYKKPGVLAVIGCVLLGVVISLCFMTVAENRAKTLTMETLLKLTENGKLEKQITDKGLEMFLDYENVVKSLAPEGSIAATCKCDLSYQGKEYELEIYYKLP